MTRSKPLDGKKKKSIRATTPDSETIDELEPGDEVLREFIADFSAAGALMRRLRRSLAASLTLTTTEHSVMLGLWYCQRRGETSVRELADHLHVAAAHVTAELNKLMKLELIDKSPSASDKRAVSVRLTKRGHDLLNKLAPMLSEVNQSLFAGVSYSEMVIAHRFLKRIIEQAPEAIHIADIQNAKKAQLRK